MRGHSSPHLLSHSLIIHTITLQIYFTMPSIDQITEFDWKKFEEERDASAIKCLQDNSVDIPVTSDQILREWNMDSNSAEFNLLKSHMMISYKSQDGPQFTKEEFIDFIIRMTKAGQMRVSLIEGRGICISPTE